MEKIFNHEKINFDIFCGLNENLRKESTDALTYTGMQVPTVVSLSYLNYAVSACVGGIFTLNGFLDIGSLSSYLVFGAPERPAMNQVTAQINQILTALAGAERIFV